MAMLHCGQCRRQVLKRKKNFFRRKKGDFSGSAAAILIICFPNCPIMKNAYISHNATLPLSDITGGNLSDDVQLSL